MISKLTRLLEEERAALLSGQFSKLQELMERKEEAVEEIRELSVHSEFVNQIKLLAERNERLIDATLSGLRDASSKLSKINISRKTVSTYDRYGHAQFLQIQDKFDLDKRT